MSNLYENMDKKIELKDYGIFSGRKNKNIKWKKINPKEGTNLYDVFVTQTEKIGVKNVI